MALQIDSLPMRTSMSDVSTQTRRNPQQAESVNSALDQVPKDEQLARDYHRQVVTTYWYMFGLLAIGLFAAIVVTLGAELGG